MPSYILEFINVLSNLAALGMLALMIGVLFQLRRNQSLMQSVIAPKTGIEAYLNMCQMVVDNDPDGTCVVSDDGGAIILVNKSMEDISGYHRSELVGQTIEILVPDAYKGVHPTHREGFITGPSSRPMRGLRLRQKRGREIAVGINLNHYRDNSGGYTIAKIRIPDDEWARRSSGEIRKMSE